MADEIKVTSGTPGPTTYGIPGTENIIDPTYGAQRTEPRPTEYNNSNFNGGHFSVARSVAGVTAVAAGGALVSFRWALSNGESLVKRIAVGAQITTVFTTAQAVDFDLVVLRNFIAADTGGTAVTPIAAGNQKLRTKFTTNIQVNDLRETSAGALTPGTATADTSAVGIGSIQQNNTIGSGFGLLDLYKEDKMGGHPLMFGNNEGFRIRTVTAMGAAGVIRFYYLIEWAEVPGL